MHLPEDARRIRSKPLSMEDNAASVLLIFQAPGENEWASGRPIFSTQPHSAGARLLDAFKRAETTRSDYNITNTAQCFPGKLLPANGKRPRDKKPPAKAIKHCSQWLLRDIQARPYDRVVVFGSPAKAAVKSLGYATDPRFQFIKHPSGGLSKLALDAAVGSQETP